MIIRNTWNKRFSESLVPKLQENLCTREFIIIRWESPTQVGQINPKSAALFGALNKSENKRSGISEILVIPVEQWSSRRLTEKRDLYAKHRLSNRVSITPVVWFFHQISCGRSFMKTSTDSWKTVGRFLLALCQAAPSDGGFPKKLWFNMHVFINHSWVIIAKKNESKYLPQ